MMYFPFPQIGWSKILQGWMCQKKKSLQHVDRHVDVNSTVNKNHLAWAIEMGKYCM
jgi:hypothetical protein